MSEARTAGENPQQTPRVRVKICGITTLEDARACLREGADALGLNFWTGSRRRCEPAEAARIVAAMGDRARLVAVVVDPPEGQLRWIREELRLRWIQLHGDETPGQLEELLPQAYKAVRLGGATDLSSARGFGGEEILVDARVAGEVGGTGQTCDWDAAATLSRSRRLWLAGGLRPGNVAEAIAAVRPHGVDVASGVESSPGVKDLALVRAFIRACRAAPARGLGPEPPTKGSAS